jgi:hypothetical protein
MQYAANTDVSCERSEAEIKSIIRRYGATQFISGWSENQAVIGFACQGRNVRFELQLPDMNDPRFVQTPGGRRQRTPAAQEAAWEQACRQRWRALALVVKAKLEAIDAGISTFDEEFLAHIVLPDGHTIGQCLASKITEIAGKKQVLALLPSPEPNR